MINDHIHENYLHHQHLRHHQHVPDKHPIMANTTEIGAMIARDIVQSPPSYDKE